MKVRGIPEQVASLSQSYHKERHIIINSLDLSVHDVKLTHANTGRKKCSYRDLLNYLIISYVSVIKTVRISELVCNI